MVRLILCALAFAAAWLIVWLVGLALPLIRTTEYAIFGFLGVGLYEGFKALLRQGANVR